MGSGDANTLETAIASATSWLNHGNNRVSFKVSPCVHPNVSSSIQAFMCVIRHMICASTCLSFPVESAHFASMLHTCRSAQSHACLPVM